MQKPDRAAAVEKVAAKLSQNGDGSSRSVRIVNSGSNVDSLGRTDISSGAEATPIVVRLVVDTLERIRIKFVAFDK